MTLGAAVPSSPRVAQQLTQRMRSDMETLSQGATHRGVTHLLSWTGRGTMGGGAPTAGIACQSLQHLIGGNHDLSTSSLSEL